MYEVREFVESYSNKINEFVIGIYVDEFGYEEHRANLQKHDNSIYKKSGGQLWLVTDKEDNIIGTIPLFKHNNEEMELKRFYVRKDYRGTGLSKFLYNVAIDMCKKSSIKKVSLGTFDKFESAIHFYEKRRI